MEALNAAIEHIRKKRGQLEPVPLPPLPPEAAQPVPESPGHVATVIRLLLAMVLVLVLLQQRLECVQVPLEPQWRAKQAKPQRPKLVQVALARQARRIHGDLRCSTTGTCV